jgi:hypothetical protein
MTRTKKKTRNKKRPTAKRRSSTRKTRGSTSINAAAKGVLQIQPPIDKDLNNLDPIFREKLQAALADLEAAGTPFRFVEGFRSVERQQWLFGSGRPTATPFGRPGPIVTQRDGVERLSNHQGTGQAGTGRGADCYPVRNGKVHIPPSSDAVWERYAQALEGHGLTAGHHWRSFVDSPHAELQVATRERSLRFVTSVPVPKPQPKRSLQKRPAVGRRRGTRGATEEMPVPAAPPVLEERTAQALVAGSGLVMAEDGVSAQSKEDIVNCTLLAQFAASKDVKDRSDVMAWYGAYFSALQKLGWVMTSQNFQEFQQSGKTVEVHKAIIGVLATVLGPGATALAITKSVLEGLSEVDSDAGWIRLFDRQTVSAKVARFQVVTAQPSAHGLVNIALFAFSVEAKKDVTQVLFFKFKKSQGSLKFGGGTASIDEGLLSSIRAPIREKLEAAAADFVASIDIPAI